MLIYLNVHFHFLIVCRTNANNLTEVIGRMKTLTFGFKVKDGAGVIMGVITVDGIKLPRPFTDQAAALEAVKELVGETKIPFTDMGGLNDAIRKSGLPVNHAAYVRGRTGSTHMDFTSGVIDAGKNEATMPEFAIMTVSETSNTFTNKAAGRTIAANLRLENEEYKHLEAVINEHPTMPESIKDAVAAVTKQTGDLACGVVRIKDGHLAAWRIVGRKGETSEPFFLRHQADTIVARMVSDGIHTISESLQVQRLLQATPIPKNMDILLRMALGLQPGDEMRPDLIACKDHYHLVVASKGELSEPFDTKKKGRSLVYSGAAQGLFTEDDVPTLLEAISALDIPEKDDPEGADGKMHIKVAMMIGSPFGFEKTITLNGEKVEDQRIVDLLEWAIGDMTGGSMDMMGMFGGSILAAIIGGGESSGLSGLPREFRELLDGFDRERSPFDR